MLKSIKIMNFRSIQKLDIFFDTRINNIIWNNWAGKTNILQAISYLFQNNIWNLKIEEYLKNWEDYIVLEWVFFNHQAIENRLLFSYDAKSDKKQFMFNWKKITKKILYENILKISYFWPTSMNLFYLGPKYRREFIDNIWKNTSFHYEKLLKNYDIILKNRNKVLKNIYEQKSHKDEIIFWNHEFIQSAKQIYEQRIPINNYMKENIKNNTHIFQNHIDTIDYVYITKVDLNNIEKSIQEYLEKNFQRDIILGKTHIWPHIDDFDILIDNKNLLHYASRWEMKSIIIDLKLLEINYIKKHTGNYPIVLIDDMSSELDTEHSDLILKKFADLQVIFTSIYPILREKIHSIYI